MKKYLIAFLLLPVIVLGQNLSKNYVKTTKYNHSVATLGSSNMYDNYYLHMDLSTGYAQDFLTDYAVGYVDVTILNDILTVEFKGTFNTPAGFQTDSQTTTIESSIPLPNIVLGNLDAAGHPDLIKVSMLGNMLYLEQNYSYTTVTSFNETFTVSLNPNAVLSEKIEDITYFDGIGRPVQKIKIGQSPKNPFMPNLLDWQNTWTTGSGSVGNYNQNGITAENTRITGMNPFGESSVLWECGTDAASDSDGGWNLNAVNVDKNVAYQYAVWVKRTGSMDGLTHHGTSNVVELNGTANTNPYFWYGDLPELNKWYLVVGLVHPASYAGSDVGVSGVYDVNGNKVLDGSEFKWDATTVNSAFRSYFYYATDLNTKQYFYGPTLQKYDGTQSSIAKFLSNSKPSDIVQHIAYDNIGRESKEYLPYASTNTLKGYDYANPLADLNNFYNTNKYDFTLNPFKEKLFDASPLNRIVEEAAPGNAWKIIAGSDSDNTTKLDYQLNSATDKVKKYSVNISGALQDGGYYAVGELFKVISKNENWKPTQTNLADNTAVEFKDKLGKVILKRSVVNGKWHDTYSVFDEYDNLVYVLPPLVNTYPSEQQIWKDQYFGQSDSETIYSNPGSFTGGNDVEVSLNDNQVYIYLGAYGQTDPVALNTSTTTPVAVLNFDPKLPDMNLGPVTTTDLNGLNPTTTHYTAYIQNGNLYFSGDGAAVYDVYAEFNINLNNYTGLPAAVIDNTMLSDLAYQYKYDEKNRLAEKKLPGKEWEYTVYDNLNRPVLNQDGNLRAQNKWLFIKYDAFNRSTYSGIWTNPVANQNRQTVQALVDTQVSPVWNETKTTTPGSIGLPVATVYYSNFTFPTSNIEVLDIKYHDNYTFDNAGLNSEASFGVTPATNVVSLETGSKTKILGTTSWVTKVNYYDAKGRIVYHAINNAYLGTVDKVKTKLDFIDKVLETESTHVKGAFALTIKDKFTYDAAGRMLTQKQQIDNQAEQLIVKNEYDELGKLASKNIGGKTVAIGEKGLQKVDYNYNIRGWIKDINNVGDMENDLFALNLNYQEQNNSYVQPMFNGNISMVNWKSDYLASPLKSYYYSYDHLDRMRTAYYAENSVLNNKFFENVGYYDRNGNILALNRYSQSLTIPANTEGIDYLNYKYKGNQISSVTDAYGASANGMRGFKDGNTVGDDYGYDFNGNLNLDKNKGITSIEYNHLNLPVKVVFNSADESSPNPKVILYKYSATGTKVERTVKEPKLISGVLTNTTITTQYDENAIYQNGTLQFFSQSEGYVAYDAAAPVNSKYAYVFQYKDQLGNVRLAYTDINDDGQVTGSTTEVFHDDFETTSGWESEGFSWGQTLTSYDNSKKHTGNLSGRIKKTTAGEWVAHSNTWVTINNTQPTDYIFSGWVYSDNPSVDIYMFKSFAGETGYPANFDYVRTYEKNRWVYVEKRVTVPANFTKLNLRIDNNGSGTVWFDNLSIRKVNVTNEIVDENNYYAFGLKHTGNTVVTGLGNALANQFKLNKKELDESLGLNLYDFGARSYDAAIGRWNTIDPKAEDMKSWSPYNYNFNNPIGFIDEKGEFPYPIFIRAFSPFDSFGGGFHGDGSSRTFSTSSNVTSRVQQTFNMNPSTYSYTGLRTWSDPSSHPILGTATEKPSGEISNFKATINQNGSTTVHFTATMAGANPLVPGSPDINVKTNFTITENTKAGLLSISVSQAGDRFPAVETFIKDTSGNALFIGVSPYEGGVMKLNGDNNNRTMMSNNFTVTIDKSGNFTGVVKNGHTYSVAAWNKIYGGRSVSVSEKNTTKSVAPNGRGDSNSRYEGDSGTDGMDDSYD